MIIIDNLEGWTIREIIMVTDNFEGRADELLNVLSMVAKIGVGRD